MIEIRLMVRNKEIFCKNYFKDSSGLDSIAKKIIKKFNNDIPGYNAQRGNINISEGSFSIIIKDYTIRENENLLYLIRRLESIILALKFGSLISQMNVNSTCDQVDANKPIVFVVCDPPIPKYAKKLDDSIKKYLKSLYLTDEDINNLLTNYKMSDLDIPEEYLCAISKQLMDDPVYIGDHKSIVYDRAQLEYWLSRKKELIDPFRNIPFTMSEVKPIAKLKEKIASYVNEKAFIQRQEDKRELYNLVLISRLNKFQQDKVSQGAILEALCQAAAKNEVNDLKFFIGLVDDVNKKDESPDSKKTALHWAVINNNIECVELLLDAGADIDIEDSAGKSPQTYTFEMADSNRNATKILDLFVKKQKEINKKLVAKRELLVAKRELFFHEDNARNIKVTLTIPEKCLKTFKYQP